MEIAPSLVVSVLFGALPEGPVVMMLARVAGVALMSIAIACWPLRDNPAAPVVMKAILFYNLTAILVFIYAAIGLQLSAVGLWPAVLLHAGLATWCVQSLSEAKKANY